MKRLFSLLLAFIIVLTSLAPVSAFASSYEDTLRSKGFPEQYVRELAELHKQHPKWIFEPLITNLNWSDAVKGERTPHSDQLIEKCSVYTSDMYCQCPSCYSNGNYIVREAGSWIAASQTAVEYYMNPLNWLDEQHIFQFESTAYDGTQTKSGVEAIIDGTWMHDSLITYRTTSGSTKLYDDKTEYSDAIMEAANYAGISAYYLAAKIRQENGGKTASNTAVNGGTSPFQGIYNYYNIGAYTGAMDGLAWAAGFLKTEKASKLYPDYDSKTKKVSGTPTTLSSGQYMTWRANAGNYYKVRLYYDSNGRYTEGASGYVPVSDCRTTYIGDTATGWGRPWSNPYKAIKFGAKYIVKSFGTQHTGYLQKFNVNPASPYLYDNEYMRNVAGAANEAVSTYNGYKSAGILEITKKFSIPVFNNMPSTAQVKGVKVKDYNKSSVTLEWDALDGYNGYQVQYCYNGSWKTCSDTTATQFKVKGLSGSGDYAFRVRAFKKAGDNYSFSDVSDEVKACTMPQKMSALTATAKETSVTLTWQKQGNATGYIIYKYNPSSKKYEWCKKVSGDKTSTKVKSLKSNTEYKFKIRAYKTINGTDCKGKKSNAVSIKTKKKKASTKVTLSSVTSPSKQKISVKWKALSGVTGYEVMWSTTSDFSSNFLSVKVKGKSKTSTTLNTAQTNRKYYVRVRAYKTSNNKTTNYKWSSTKSVKVK